MTQRIKTLVMRAFVFTALMTSSTPSYSMPWQMNPTLSSLTFSGVQTGTPFTGEFEQFTVNINFDPEMPEAATLYVIIDLTSAKTEDTQRDTALPQADWFNTSEYTTATFASKGFSRNGAGQFNVAGVLDLKGIRKEITFPFDLSIKDGVATATGSFPLNRAEFNVGAGPWTEGKWVALNVDVAFKITAHAEKNGN